MFKLLLLLITTSFMLAGCDKQPAKEIGYGVIKEGSYRNSYFNMSIKLPEKWSIQSQAERQKLVESGADLLFGDDTKLKKTLKSSAKKTVNMFTVFMYDQGAPVSFNPSIISMAEKVSSLPGIKRGSDYLYHVKKLLESAKIPYSFPEKIYSKEYSGVTFDILPAEIKAGDTIVYQKYYSSRINDYILSFVLSFSSNDEEQSLNNVINTLKFKAQTRQ